MNELEMILRGNHMVNLLTVKRKAETIMRQVQTSTSSASVMTSSAGGTGGTGGVGGGAGMVGITMNELVVISKKFPNILLPTLNLT